MTRVDQALAKAESAGMARARECILAVVEAEVERLRALTGDRAETAHQIAGAIKAATDILDLIRALDIAMPTESA